MIDAPASSRNGVKTIHILGVACYPICAAAKVENLERRLYKVQATERSCLDVRPLDKASESEAVHDLHTFGPSERWLKKVDHGHENRSDAHQGQRVRYGEWLPLDPKADPSNHCAKNQAWECLAPKRRNLDGERFHAGKDQYLFMDRSTSVSRLWSLRCFNKHKKV